MDIKSKGSLSKCWCMRCSLLLCAVLLGLQHSVAFSEDIAMKSFASENLICVTEGAMSSKVTAGSNGDRVVETALGDLFADALRLQTHADVAFIAAGELDGTLSAGRVTYADIKALLPSAPQMGLVEVDSDVLWEMLEIAISEHGIDASEHLETSMGSDGFLQMSGLAVEFDPTQPVGSRVRNITLDDGRTLVYGENTPIVLVASTAVLDGGFGYDVLSSYPYQSVGDMVDIIATYLSRMEGAITRPTLNRVTWIGTRDQTLFEAVHGKTFLPYVILVMVLFTLSNQRHRERNLDGTFSNRIN